MEIELSEVMEQLQGHWKLDTDEHTILIIGNELTVFANSKADKTTFQLIRNLQLKKWQIKVLKPLSWLRTFIIDITPDTFMLYDFDIYPWLNAPSCLTRVAFITTQELQPSKISYEVQNGKMGLNSINVKVI